MLKVILGCANGTTIWAFGLSQMNVRKLQEGQPLLFNLSDMGLPPQQVLLFYGPTEEVMETELHKAVRTAPPGSTSP